MLLVSENLVKSEVRAKRNHLYGKVAGNSLGGHESWLGQSLRNHQGRANSVSQADGVSHILMALWLYGGRVQKRNSGLWQHFCLGESCFLVLTLLPDSWLPSHMSLMPFKLLPLHSSTEGMNWSEYVHGSFKRITWDSKSLSSTASIPTSFYS